jgi:hypothetical protein
VFSGVFTAEVVDGGDKQAGDMTTAHIQTLLKALSDMSLIACFVDEAFFLKQNFQSWDYSSQIIVHQSKGTVFYFLITSISRLVIWWTY